MKLPITLIVLTYNEEVNLRACLDSVKDWVSEIIIVDSPSSDKTVEIAREYTDKIFTHPFKNQADQWNWAIDNLAIENEWILKLDGDEYMTRELLEELAVLLPSLLPDVNGIFMKRRFYFLGRWIRHGGYYPAWLMRLTRRGYGRSEEREMDEHLILTEGKAVYAKNDFIHDDKKGLTYWIEKHNKYAAREARVVLSNSSGLVIQGRRDGDVAEKNRWLKNNVYYRMPKFLRVFIFFFYRYLLRGGFLDGMPGFIYHFLQGFWFRFLIDSKIYEMQVDGHGEKQKNA